MVKSSTFPQSALDALPTDHAMTIDRRRGDAIDPAVVCWYCEESIGLEVPADLSPADWTAAIAEFIRHHARCNEYHYRGDDGEDTRGIW